MARGGVDQEGEPLGVDAARSQRDGEDWEGIVVDPFAADAPVVSEAKRRGWTRQQAIAHGRALAEDENRRLEARGHLFDPAGRIKRAEEYAAWEYDGRLSGTIGKRQ